MVGVGNFSFLSCVVAQPVDWLLRAVGFLMMQPEFSMALGNTVLVMGLNFRGLQTNDKRGKFSFRVKLNFRRGESSILLRQAKYSFGETGFSWWFSPNSYASQSIPPVAEVSFSAQRA